jgi:hypothetical protein
MTYAPGFFHTPRWNSGTNNNVEFGPGLHYDSGMTVQADVKNPFVVPGWRSKCNHGYSATGPYFRLITEVVYGGWGYFTVYKWHGTPGMSFRDKSKVFGQISGDSGYTGLHLDASAADNLALTDAHRKVRGTQIKMSGQVFLGELREAVHMITSPVKTLRQGISSYVTACRGRTRGLKRDGPRVRDILSDTWLEFSFGWKPFIADIKDGIAAYNNVFDRDHREKVKGFGHTEDFSDDIRYVALDFGSLGVQWFQYLRTRRTQREATVYYNIGIRSTREGVTFADTLQEDFGLVSREFIPTIWELIPYSFLVDYFTNVGDLLSCAATDLSGITWVSKAVVQKIHYHELMVPSIDRCRAFVGDSFISASASDSQLRVTGVQFTRTSLGTIGTPSFSVTYPGANSPFKWLNIAALASNRFL